MKKNKLTRKQRVLRAIRQLPKIGKAQWRKLSNKRKFQEKRRSLIDSKPFYGKTWDYKLKGKNK